MHDVEYGSIPNTSRNDNDINEQKSEPNLVIFGKEIKMNRRELIASILLALFFYLNWTYFAMFPVILPHEAMKKGLNETQVGFIFGIFQLVLFLLYPVFGKYLNAIGIKFLFVGGLLLASTGGIAFAFLDKLPNGMIYFLMSLLCRTITGVGASMGISYAIVAHSFPNNVASVVAALEFVSGIGFMTGPLLGGALFQLGGFELPYLILGGLMALLFLVSIFLFPDSKRSAVRSDEPTSLPIMPLLKIPQFILTLMTMFVSCLGINFLEPTLQIHLMPLGLKPVQLGFVFFTPAITYTTVTPIVGYVCDKYPKILPYLMMLSMCLSVVAYSILGPLPYFDLPLNITTFLMGYILFGIAYTGIMVPVYTELTRISRIHGYPNDLRTQGLISGLFSCVHSLAAFIGPMVGGVSVQMIGYRLSVFGIICLLIITGISYSISYFSTSQYAPIEPEEIDDSEDRPILQNK